MRITEQMRFRHPVLSRMTGDFKAGEFQFAATFEERPTDGQLRLLYDCKITELDMERFVVDGQASVGVFVTCLETYFNELQRLQLGKGEISFPAGLLRGRVVVRPMIWLEKNIHGWRSINIHDEFGSESLDFDRSALVGFGEEIVINVGWDKLSPIESIFTLVASDEVREGQFFVDLDAEKIKIIAGRNTHRGINNLRSSKPGKIILLNAVYLPALMEVLQLISGNASQYEGRRWHKPFIAKCEYFEIDIDNPDLLDDAQKLLNSPLNRILDIPEAWS